MAKQTPFLFTIILSALFLICLSASVVKGNEIQQQFLLGSSVESGRDEGALVPGNARLRYCSEGEELTDGMGIEYVDLDPYPAIRGENLTITASGFLNKTINEGAIVHLKVRIGYITVINRNFDLCEQSESLLGLKCPIPKGPIQITKETNVPKAVPYGKLTMTANAINDDDSEIICLKGQIQFD